jgi:hypothetical protein
MPTLKPRWGIKKRRGCKRLCFYIYDSFYKRPVSNPAPLKDAKSMLSMIEEMQRQFLLKYLNRLNGQ